MEKLKKVLRFVLPILLICIISIFWLLPTFACDTLKFVQVSDIHLSNRTQFSAFKMLSDSKPLLEDALDQINSLKNIDFVMETGDGVDTPKPETLNEYIDYMNKLKFPWYMAAGNHDIAYSGKMTKEKYVSILRAKNKNYTFDKTYYTFEPKKGFKVFVLDAVIDFRLTSNGYISEKQLDWLDYHLRNMKKDEVALIFLHHPVYEPISAFHHKILNSEAFYNILKKHDRVIAVFSGHYHVTKIIPDGKMLHVSTPALVSYPNGFRIVKVKNYKDKVSFKFNFIESRLADVVEKAKASKYEACAGEEQDRVTTVTIKK